jgi:CheY-like chemotaxis protein
VLHGANVECTFNLNSRLWEVEADAGQIEQVIHNLVLNAIQAMPEGGRLEIKGKNVNLQKGAIPALNAGEYVQFTVQDTGPGISAEILPKIFDPYFTTKSHGSGLGLTVCYSIVKKHDGYLTVKSIAGKGSIFYLYLPALIGRQVSETPKKPDKTIAVGSNQGRVLVMDDEPGIRSVLVKQLKILGYEASAVKDGEEAVALYQENLIKGHPFDVVLLDLTIPGGMGGKQTLVELLKLDPKVKAIVSSGYASDSSIGDYKAYGFVGVLLKPYMLSELRESILSIFREKP